MEGSSSPLVTKSEAENKCVQELVNDRVEVPDRYMHQDAFNGAINASFPLIEVPIIDLSHLASSSVATKEEELEKLRSALTSWGCFQVINHGIELAILDELQEVARQFFHLPAEEKQKYVRPVDEDIEGYGTDKVLIENQTLDWTDRLYLLVNPEDVRKLQYWPQTPKSFRKILHEYSAKITMMIEFLLRSAAKTLELAENSFLDECGERPIMYSRLNYYPPCPRPEHVLGLKAHTDGSAITVLLQDKNVEGLQLLKDNQWSKVPIIPHALLVNAGDQLEIISNGVFKSPMHRVLTNSEKERISIAMFWAPESGKEIEPLAGLSDDNRPRLFKKVNDYPQTYFKYYQQGKRAIDTVRI